MGDPCEFYVHLARQLDRFSRVAIAAEEAGTATISTAAGEEASATQQAAAEDTPGEVMHFLHQAVQALSIALLSAKVS